MHYVMWQCALCHVAICSSVPALHVCCVAVCKCGTMSSAVWHCCTMTVGDLPGHHRFQLHWKIPWRESHAHCSDNINSVYCLLSGHETPSTEFSNATEIHSVIMKYGKITEIS